MAFFLHELVCGIYREIARKPLAGENANLPSANSRGRIAFGSAVFTRSR